MPRNNIPRCQRCVDLEGAHDLEMEFFISLVDEQSRLFRKRQNFRPLATATWA